MTEEELFKSLLKTEYIGRNAEWFDKISSTNDYVKENANTLPDGYLAATTEQYAGKGRRGHVWLAKKGDIAAFSFLLKNSFYADKPPITLICGLAAAKALSKLTGRKFEIKWPNDIVFEGQKVCGILCESRLINKNCFTVCGIGINLTQEKDYFINANIPHAASLKLICAKAPNPAETVAFVANEFEKIYKTVMTGERADSESFIKDYEKNCVTVGSDVKIIKPDREILGKAIAVNLDGSLKVKSGEEELDVLASEASVRGVMGYSL